MKSIGIENEDVDFIGWANEMKTKKGDFSSLLVRN